MSGTRPKRVIRTVRWSAKRRSGDKLNFLEGDLGDQAAFELFVLQESIRPRDGYHATQSCDGRLD